MIRPFWMAAGSALMLAGCAKPIPLNNISYTGTVSASSEMTARLNILLGPSGQIYSRSIGLGADARPAPHLHFDVEDQRAFGESLRAELLRLRLFRSVIDALNNQRTDMNINLHFMQTLHNVSRQEYTLDIEMQLTGGSKPFLKQYVVVSSERDTSWEKWTTTAYVAKAKAVKLLLDKLIPDIEAYIPASQ